MPTPPPSRARIATFVLLAATWGSSFLLVKVGLDGLSPRQVATGRILLGAATLGLLMRVTGRRWPRSRTVWAHLLVVALFLNVIPFILLAWAERSVPSSVASIFNATTPLMTMVAGRLLVTERRLRGPQIAGLVTGLIGVIILIGPWQADDGGWAAASIRGQLALLAMTACYGFGLTHLRRHLDAMPADAVTLAATQVTLAAAVMLVAAPVAARGTVHPTPRVVAAMLALGCLGTGIAYVWNTGLVRAWGATRAATVTYLTPVVGVLLGITVLHEHLSWTEPCGGAVVLTGIALTNRPAPRAQPLVPDYQI